MARGYRSKRRRMTYLITAPLTPNPNSSTSSSIGIAERFAISNMAMSMAWLQRVIIRNRASNFVSADSSRFFSKSSTPYVVKVGIPEFLKGIGNGVESHVAKLESELGDFQKLLVTRTLKLKKLGIPCKHRKLILKYTHKYRLGLWRPRAEPIKA